MTQKPSTDIRRPHKALRTTFWVVLMVSVFMYIFSPERGTQ